MLVIEMVSGVWRVGCSAAIRGNASRHMPSARVMRNKILVDGRSIAMHVAIGTRESYPAMALK